MGSAPTGTIGGREGGLFAWPGTWIEGYLIGSMEGFGGTRGGMADTTGGTGIATGPTG